MNKNTRHTSRLTRRALGRAALGTVAGALLSEPADAQTDKPATPDTLDSRLALLEKGHAKPLSDDLKKAVRENIKSNDATADKLRAFTVPDGTEPATIFHPTPITPLPWRESRESSRAATGPRPEKG